MQHEYDSQAGCESAVEFLVLPVSGWAVQTNAGAFGSAGVFRGFGCDFRFVFSRGCLFFLFSNAVGAGGKLGVVWFVGSCLPVGLFSLDEFFQSSGLFDRGRVGAEFGVLAVAVKFVEGHWRGDLCDPRAGIFVVRLRLDLDLGVPVVEDSRLR